MSSADNLLLAQQFNSKKSRYDFEIFQTPTKQRYVKITQRLTMEAFIEKKVYERPDTSILIRMEDFPAIIELLQQLRKDYNDLADQVRVRNKLSERTHTILCKEYLRGVSIKNLGLMFDLPHDEVADVLLNNGIEIADMDESLKVFRASQKKERSPKRKERQGNKRIGRDGWE